jgi:hypothetical protein
MGLRMVGRPIAGVRPDGKMQRWELENICVCLRWQDLIPIIRCGNP